MRLRFHPGGPSGILLPAALAAAALCLPAGPAAAALSDPAGDFLATYVGPRNADLDVVRVDAT